MAVRSCISFLLAFQNYPHFFTFSIQPLMYRAFVDVREERLSLTLPSHFGSHSLPSQNSEGSKRKSEGDVMENECPSRALSPLYIGIRDSSCEKVRVTLCQPFLGIDSQNPHWSCAISLLTLNFQSEAFKLSVRSLQTLSPTPSDWQFFDLKVQKCGVAIVGTD